MREGLGRLRDGSSLKTNPYLQQECRIEMAFSKFKALLRAAAARTIDELGEAIRLALGAFTPSECQNHFAAAGYNAT